MILIGGHPAPAVAIAAALRTQHVLRMRQDPFPQLPSLVGWWRVDNGDRVRAGDILVNTNTELSMWADSSVGARVGTDGVSYNIEVWRVLQ